MDILEKKNGLSVRAYKGDAMNLLAFDLEETKIKDFVGFSIKVTPPVSSDRTPFFLLNRMIFNETVYKDSGIDPTKANINSTQFSPLQIFRWVHTPATNNTTKDLIFGEYLYEISPRYLIGGILQKIDDTLTVGVKIDLSPFEAGDLQVGFTRGFIESQAYARKFGLNNNMRPNKTKLIFDRNVRSGPSPKDLIKNPKLKDYTFEDQFVYLGWQTRRLIMKFLKDVLNNPKQSLDVFAFDLDEPEICEILLQLAQENRLRILLDNSDSHSRTTDFETMFDTDFPPIKKADRLVRGKFGSLAHSKVFIQKDADGKPIRVLTGSTNFSTNGLYINANHVLVFNNNKVAELYEKAFEDSFSDQLMSNFSKSGTAMQDFVFNEPNLPVTTIRFAPHTLKVAQKFFDTISQRILNAKTDVLFAIMKDTSKSSILDAVQTQVRDDKIFTYGITDQIGDKTTIFLYKPNSKRGIRVAGRPGEFILPPPFEKEASIPGISVHHKFVVVDFKGNDPTLYCGSSNLAFGPEQRNGDNLIEIHDKDTVTAFAIEAIRLVDHFHFRNKQLRVNGANSENESSKPLLLDSSATLSWIKPYYSPDDLKCLERELFIK